MNGEQSSKLHIKASLQIVGGIKIIYFPKLTNGV